MPGYKNSIKSPQYVENTILDKNGSPVGTFRLKPSSVMWKPKGKRKFYSVNFDVFREWISASSTKASQAKS